MKKRISIYLLLAIQLLAGSVYFVKTNGNDSYDGKTWGNAFKSVQKAYDSSVSGDQVWIAQGTYKPSFDFGLNIGESGKHFRLKNGVTFYGGFSGVENSPEERDFILNRTILSGDIGIENDSTDNTYHVFYHPAGVGLDNSAVLDGFVISGGTAKANEGDHRMGSGMFNMYSSPTIRNCEFSENHSYGYLGGGGGIYNLYSGPVIENCIFTKNFAAHDGAGIFNIVSSPIVTNCKFYNNLSEFGTVFNNSNCTPHYTNCEFYNNIAAAGGGGMVNKDCSPVIDRCIFIGNQATISAGGAIWNESDGCKALISNCLIADNSVQGSKGGLGGGISNYNQCTPTIINCTIVNNRSTNWGGGIFIRECAPDIINCIIRNNSADVSGDQIYVTAETTVTVNNTCYSDSSEDIQGNVDFIDCTTEDPGFLISGEDQYGLQNSSPCVDTGNNTGVISVFDLNDKIRIWDGDENGSEVVDMGCYELVSDDADFEFNIAGNIQLIGQTDHSGCEIIFQMKYPVNGQTFVAVSDLPGNYNANIVRGIYDVTFQKQHYYSVKFENVNCYSDSTLNNVNLVMKSILSGSLSGTLPKNLYSVMGNIFVNTGNILNIDPGTILEFDPGTGFIVNGILNASGSEEDSIRFINLESRTWEGLNFISTADSSVMKYCIVTGSNSSGIYNSGADIILTNSRISGNDAAAMGGAIVFKNDNSLIRDCMISNNLSVAVYLYGSHSYFSNCIFRNNDLGAIIATDGSITIDNCAIFCNSGYGINSGSNSSTLVINSVISGNSGDGIYALSPIRFINSISCNNFTGFKNSSASIPQEIAYSCFSGNLMGNFINCDLNIGVLNTLNSNGVPSDEWYNITLDPKFADPAAGNFILSPDSPCIDAGIDTITGYTFPEKDLTGGSRFNDGNGDNTPIVDMGAYEFNDYQYFQNAPTLITGVFGSSSSSGDYDNDGDLDILLTGNTPSGAVTKLYKNYAGSFTEVSTGIQNIYMGSTDWGDYDNDGDIDILITGYTGTKYISNIYRNENGTFVNINAGLTGIGYGAGSWGDYDNDGDLDILLTGYVNSTTKLSVIYRNSSGTFADISAGLTPLSSSSAAWGDYDNDGDLDILLTGYSVIGAVSNIYRNDNGVFTNINAGLTGVFKSSVAWGDYDNDCDLDILLTGMLSSSTYCSKVFRNDGDGVFTDIVAPIANVGYSSAAWGDYNNDGYTDIFICGFTGSTSVSIVYKNQAGTSFTDSGASLAGVRLGSISLGDIDNDSDLDMLLTGYAGSENITKLYKNLCRAVNSKPVVPENLSSVNTGSEVVLNWSKATDLQTPQNGLSYNLYIGTTPLTGNKKSPMSDILTGFRKVVSSGNAGGKNTWTVKNLTSGTYYWSVQAVDNTYSGSLFPTEQTFTIEIIPQNINITYSTGRILITWTEVQGASSYKVYSSIDPFGTFTDVSTQGSFSGTSWNQTVNGNKLFYYVTAVTAK